MLFQSLRALCLAAGGPGSVWNHLGVPMKSTGVSGRFVCDSWTDVHVADAVIKQVCRCSWRTSSCELEYHNRACLVIYMQAVVEWVRRYT
jgi:hypothetical protein